MPVLVSMDQQSGLSLFSNFKFPKMGEFMQNLCLQRVWCEVKGKDSTRKHTIIALHEGLPQER